MSNVDDFDFDAVSLYHEVGPGGIMIIPLQDVAIRITGLKSGGCRVEVVPALTDFEVKGSARLGVRK